MKKLLLWTAGIAGTILAVDTMRIKEWITLPIQINNLVLKIPEGDIDFKTEGKVGISGSAGNYQIDLPVILFVWKPTGVVMVTKTLPPIKLPKEIVSKLSIYRIAWALRKISIKIVGQNLIINIPAGISYPIYW